eukprot:1365687-Amorphochlora_amoeboformis.AAC.1
MDTWLTGLWGPISYFDHSPRMTWLRSHVPYGILYDLTGTWILSADTTATTTMICLRRCFRRCCGKKVWEFRPSLSFKSLCSLVICILYVQVKSADEEDMNSKGEDNDWVNLEDGAWGKAHYQTINLPPDISHLCTNGGWFASFRQCYLTFFKPDINRHFS